MESALARQSHQDLIEAAKKMTPAQRLKAFVTHSHLLIKLQEAGAHFRQLKGKPRPSK